ncbi:MAG: hypothetical protein K5683_07790 [Prevotella sp.]|nr:hypothetical protein [Prevotella sp.]
MKKMLLTLGLLVVCQTAIRAEVDPNFYVYLCFGQSNMEGQAQPESMDKTVDARFQMLAAQNFSNPNRKMGQWYSATPPIVRMWAGVGMADYFGRTMVAALPANITIGVVDVAVGGIAIEGFMADKVEAYLKTTESWLQDLAAAYDNNPYQRLVDMGRIAQQKGVIKGILMHQGETNNGQQDWPQKVKQVYESLLSDLGLNAADVPLFAGETVNADVGGTCSLHNSIIAKLPQVIPTAHVIPSNGCPCASDNIHFTIDGYRTMGKRYAYEVLRTMGRQTVVDADYQLSDALKKLYTMKSLDAIDDITIRVGGSKRLTVWGTFGDGHRENLSNECTFTSNDFTIEGSTIKADKAVKGTVTIAYTDFTGKTSTMTVNVEASDMGPNHLLMVDNGTAGSNQWDKEAICTLTSSMQKGKTYVVTAQMRADNPNGCALWPIFSTSTNRNQWDGSNDVQYLASYNLTKTLEEYKWEFSATFPHDKLQFAFGLIGGKVYFDNVSCIEKETGKEMVANGTFEADDISNWEVLGWAGQKISIVEETDGANIDAPTLFPATGNYYDLNGRQVEQPSRGIYILSGKKVVK